MRKNNFIEIKDFNVLAGTSIQDAVKEGILLAKMFDCIIRFNFNGVEMEIYDFSDITQQVEYYGRRLKESEK